MALKVAVVAPAATVTEAGTVSERYCWRALRWNRRRGAVWVRVTVQVLTALAPRLVGLQTRVETSTGATRLMVAVWELVPRVAVTVAL